METCHGRVCCINVFVHACVFLKIHIKGCFLAGDTSLCAMGGCRRAESGNGHHPICCWFVWISCLVSAVYLNLNKLITKTSSNSVVILLAFK